MTVSIYLENKEAIRSTKTALLYASVNCFSAAIDAFSQAGTKQREFKV